MYNISQIFLTAECSLTFPEVEFSELHLESASLYPGAFSVSSLEGNSESLERKEGKM